MPFKTKQMAQSHRAQHHNKNRTQETKRAHGDSKRHNVRERFNERKQLPHH